MSTGSCAFGEAVGVLGRAEAEGFAWRTLDEAWRKVIEEVGEVRATIVDDACEARMDAELGDLLFAVVNVLRWIGVDPATALHSATDKFQSRLDMTRDLAAGTALTEVQFEGQLELWRQAKRLVG